MERTLLGSATIVATVDDDEQGISFIRKDGVFCVLAIV